MTRLFRSSIPSERLLVTGLILLLAFQLTGLSCINDSQSPFSPSRVNHISSQDQSLEGANDIPDKHPDGCPCHLVFQSSLFSTLQPVSLVISRDTPSPAIYTNTFVESLFHPPILHSPPHFGNA
jgi:hypothetical protein